MSPQARYINGAKPATFWKRPFKPNNPSVLTRSEADPKKPIASGI
jgi:hypothetical protein